METDIKRKVIITIAIYAVLFIPLGILGALIGDMVLHGPENIAGAGLSSRDEAIGGPLGGFYLPIIASGVVAYFWAGRTLLVPLVVILSEVVVWIIATGILSPSDLLSPLKMWLCC